MIYDSDSFMVKHRVMDKKNSLSLWFNQPVVHEHDTEAQPALGGIQAPCSVQISEKNEVLYWCSPLTVLWSWFVQFD